MGPAENISVWRSTAQPHLSRLCHGCTQLADNAQTPGPPAEQTLTAALNSLTTRQTTGTCSPSSTWPLGLYYSCAELLNLFSRRPGPVAHSFTPTGQELKLCHSSSKLLDGSANIQVLQNIEASGRWCQTTAGRHGPADNRSFAHAGHSAAQVAAGAVAQVAQKTAARGAPHLV